MPAFPLRPTRNDEVADLKVAIIGGSLGGLAAANVCHRLGAHVTVFEKQASSMERRGACLGFVDVGLWEAIRGKRMEWPSGKSVTRVPPPDGKQSFENQGSFYYVRSEPQALSVPRGTDAQAVQSTHHTLVIHSNRDLPGGYVGVSVLRSPGWLRQVRPDG